MSLIQGAINRYQQDGATGVIRGGGDLFHHKFSSIADNIRKRYYIHKGHIEFEIEDTTVEFSISSPEEYHELHYFKNNELGVLADVLNEVQPEDTFYDVGANLGAYSVMTSCNGTTSVAIEPYPPNVERLRNNIAENDTEVEVVESAVGADSGSVAFEIEDTEEIGSVGIASGQESTKRETINVSMNTLDAISRDLDAPDVVKIDVEGAEGLVLDGAHQTLEDCRTIYLEIHFENAYGSSTHDFGYSPDDLYSVLEDHGFQIKTLKDKTNQKIIKAE